MGGPEFVALVVGFGSEREARERRGYEPFALHAPRHQAILGCVVKLSDRATSSCCFWFRVQGSGFRVQGPGFRV